MGRIAREGPPTRARSGRRGGPWVVASAGLVALVAASCLHATAIDAQVYTEVACSENAAVTVVVGSSLDDLASRLSQGVVSSTQTGCAASSGGSVGDVVFLPQHDGESITFAVMTRPDGQPSDQCGSPSQAAGCIVAKRQVSYLSHQQLDVRVDLRLSCLGVTCPADQTCVKGQCVDAVVPPSCAPSCSESSLSPPDGGTVVDAGPTPDGGHAPDATRVMDAQPTEDSPVDAQGDSTANMNACTNSAECDATAGGMVECCCTQLLSTMSGYCISSAKCSASFSCLP